MDVFAALIPLVLALLAAPPRYLPGPLSPRMRPRVGTTFAALAALGLCGGGFRVGHLGHRLVPSWNVHFMVALTGLRRIRPAGDRIASRCSSTPRATCAPPGARGAPALGRHCILLLLTAIHGLDGGASDGSGPHLVFVVWTSHAIASYYLIGFDRHKEESRASAIMALLSPDHGGASPYRGAPALRERPGPSRSRLARLFEPGPLLTGSALLIAVAGLAKSAQAPFHLWRRGRWPRPRRSPPTSTRRRWSPRGLC